MDAASILDHPVSSLVGSALGIPVNTLIIFILANYVINLGGKCSFKSCITCAAGMALVQAVACGAALTPIPLLNLILPLFIWYKGSVAVIEGSLEATKGGFTILVICTIISMAAIFATMAASAG